MSESYRRSLKARGFKPAKWWQAWKEGKMLLETKDPREFVDSGLIDDPDVTFSRTYTKTESKPGPINVRYIHDYIHNTTVVPKKEEDNA